VIGENVMIYNNTNIGADRHYEVGQGSEDVASRAAHIGDGGIVYAYAVVQGPYNIGENAVCGLRVILDEDIPPGALKTQKSVRLAGEWPGARGARWRDFAEDRP
jgi:serine acetyltransferase